ncbi:MAG: type II secretion system protein [Candidatus Levybacteria bacterium]|nr:type II secretion system protein [Candidatus Levybacteria bacterium]
MKTPVRINQKGFTLIELLVVVGILAVLLAITLVAVNPARNFAQANNASRQAAVNAILGAISAYIADNKGLLPPGIATGDANKGIASTVGGTGSAFCSAIVNRYIAALPIDPQSGSYTDCTTYNTVYTISVTTPGPGDSARVTIKAPLAELVQTISVTR